MRLWRTGIYLTVNLAVIAFFAISVNIAHAQEASVMVNVGAATDQLQRTPALVVHEIPTPASSLKPATPTTQQTQGAPQKNAAVKSPAAGAPAKAQSAQSAQSTQSTQPIVLPAAAIISARDGRVTTGNPKYDELIAASAARNGVDPDLVTAVMRQESGFHQNARSYKGATGLMQLMPGTAARFGVTNIFDPAQNIEGGTKYLRFLLDSFDGDVDLALAGYNAGEHAVMNSGYKIPRYRETQNYVRSISARYDASKKTTRRVAVGTSTAPAATIFSGGAASSRLSNNY
ncbi:MAG TPA: transglycosylase SLT domain-containing protein [Blastocatellia bacterium]|nr:transglycosylase SLT domain-containing protein [Blastocatellia bacterium]